MAQQAISSFIARSDEPLQEEARIRGAFFLSKALGIDAGDAFARYPEYIEAWTGKRLEPVSGTKALAESWETGWNIVEQGRAGWDLMMDPTSEKAWRHLEEIQRNQPPEDHVKRALPVEMLKALLKQLPFMVEIQKYGMAGLAAGAATGAGVAALGGALLPVPEEAVTVPALMIKFGHIGWKIGNVFGASRTTAGLIFADIMQMEDEFGNRVPIDIARASSLGGGFLSGLMEAATLSRLTGGSTAVRRALAKVVPLTLHKAGAGFGRNALAFMTKYGTNIGVEVLQELAQESVEFSSKELAVAMANAQKEFNIPQAELDDFLELLEMTATETLKAVPLMILPGTAIEFGRSGRPAAGSGPAAGRTSTLNEALATIIETADEATLDSVIDQIEKLNPEPDVELEVKSGDSGFAVTEKATGRSVGNLQYTVEDETIRIDALEAETPAARRALAMELKKEFTGRLATLNPDAPNAEEIRRAIEDTDPELQEANRHLDLLESNIEGLMNQITELDTQIAAPETAEDAANLEDVREELEETRVALETAELRKLRIQEAKAKVDVADSREVWEKPAEDHAVDAVARDDVRVETFTNQVRDGFPQYSEPEVAAAVGLVKARARAMGMRPGQWIDTYLAPEVFSPAAVSDRILKTGKYTTAVQFLEDGRAILHASKGSDISSWIHEMAHVFRRQLTPEQLGVVEAWLGVDPGAKWTRAQEEKYAQGMEQYVREGYAPSGELASLFEQFTKWLAEIYRKYIAFELPSEARQAYDELFVREAGEAAAVELRTEREAQRHKDAKKVSGSDMIAGKYQWEMDIAEYEERLALAGRLLQDIPDAELLDAIDHLRATNYQEPGAKPGEWIRKEPVPARNKVELRKWARERIDTDFIEFVRENQGRVKSLTERRQIEHLIPEDRRNAVVRYGRDFVESKTWTTFAHRRFVEKALKAGIRVKPFVLGEYRDLAEQFPNLMDPDYEEHTELEEREHDQQEMAFEEPEVHYQLSKTQLKLAKAMGTLSDTTQKIFDELDKLNDLETDSFNWIVGLKGAYAGDPHAVSARHKNLYEMNNYLDQHPEAVARLSELEKLFHSRILDKDGHLIPTPLEQRTTYDEKIDGDYQLFKSAYRNFAQRLVDNMDAELFEQIRSDLVRATELAYEQKAELPAEFAKHLAKTLSQIDSKYGLQPAIRTAHKTEAAANIQGECPMFMIGGRGCWLDKCYVTEQARGSSAQNMYGRAMYTGEILQLTARVIYELNKNVGGLRLNGQGDLTQFNRAQLRDVMKHAAMVGLDLKMITKQTDVMDMINDFLTDKDPNVRKSAEDIVIQASVDPWWVRVETDVNPGSLASLYVPGYMRAVEKGDKDLAKLLGKEVIKMYRDAGRDAKFINGQLYRKYGFSSKQIGAIAKKYPKLKLQIRSVVSTPREIAETALRTPEILQTWMHAKLPGQLWSDTEQAFLQDVQYGNYTSPIVIQETNAGRWEILAQAAESDTEGIRRPDYTAVEDYIYGVDENGNQRYTAEEQNQIFETLAGQLDINPSALCCKAGASVNVCNNCLSLCHGHSFLQGDKLAALAQTARINLLFQGPLDEFQRVEELAGREPAIKAWHGSPAEFEAFSTDYMSTGEGGQAFGWGLYFGTRKALGVKYAKQLAESGSRNLYKVKLFRGDKNPNLMEWYDPPTELQKELIGQQLAAEGLPPFDIDAVPGSEFDPNYEDYLKGMLQEANLKVADASPAEMARAMANLDNAIRAFKMTGEHVYESLGYRNDWSKQEVSEFLLRAGIKGIRMPADSKKQYATSYPKYIRGENYVVFDAADVEIDEHVLFQPAIDPEHEAIVKEAVETGRNVPDQMLENYRTKVWAAEELDRREVERQKLINHEQLAQDALEYGSEQEFIEFIETMGAEEIEVEGETMNLEDRHKWLTDFYLAAHAQSDQQSAVLDINEGNRRWYESLDDEALIALLEELGSEREGAMNFGFHGTMIAAGLRLKGGRTLTPKLMQQIRSILKNNTTKYRELVAQFHEDQDTLQRIELERIYSQANDIDDETYHAPPRDRREIIREVQQLRKRSKIDTGEIRIEEIDTLLQEINRELAVSMNREKSLLNAAQRDRRRIQRGGEVLEERRKELAKSKRKEQTLERQIAKLEAQKQEVSETLQSARQEARSQTEEQQRQLSELMKEARQEAAEGTRSAVSTERETLSDARREAAAGRTVAIKNERLRIRALEAERKAARALKDYARKLSASITRQIPKTVDRIYAEQIQALQAGVDPNYRTKRTLATWGKRQQFFNANPEAFDTLSAKTQQRMYQRSLNDIPLSELEDIVAQVDHLIKLGRLKLRLRREAETREIAQIASRIGTTILNGEELRVNTDDAEPILEGRRTIGEAAAEAFLRTLRPSRLADMADGGADFHGLTHQEFIDKVNDAYNEEIRQRMRRESAATTKMAELGLTIKGLAETRAEVANHHVSVDQILKIYANLQNELNTKAMVHGNHIKLELAEELIGKLTQAEKDFADFIIEEYDDNYDRLEGAHLILTNERLIKQRRYTPMGRMEVDMTPHPETLIDEMSQAYGVRRGRVFKGMTFKRVNVPDEAQRPIDLSGLYVEWGQQIVKQEHYINAAPLVHKLQRVLSVRALKDSFAQKGKQALHKRLSLYVDRYANPNVMYSMGNDNKIWRAIRKNTALAYLAFNMVTGVKQLVSLAYYSAAASPADLMAGLMQTAFKWQETRETMMRLAPQLIDRSIEREFEELKRLNGKGFQKITKAVGKVGMWHILAMDKIAVTAGWKAIYDKHIRHGASETEAAQEATNVTLRTQPAFTPKDVAEIYASDGFMSMFLQFSNQLNQLWNMGVYDAPQAFKNKHFARGVAMYSSIALSGAFMWMLANRRLPEDPEDFVAMARDTILKPVPLLGGAITSAMDGYSAGNVSFYKLPTAIGRNLDMVLDAVVAGKEISSARLASNMKQLIEAQAVFFGVPGYLEGKRVIEGTIEGVKDKSAWTPVQYIMLGGKIKPKKEK